MDTNSFDAIVVGTGMSGGWAAKELTEKGLKTLVLDRGRMVRHGEYPTATTDPWDLPYGNRITQETRRRKPVQTRTGYPTPANQHWFVDDLENPYTEVNRFDWMRGYHVGGRSLMWARQSYRFSPMDFEANAKEGVGDALAGELRRNRAVVRLRGDLRRHQRQRRRHAARCRMENSCRRWISTASRSISRSGIADKLGRKLIIGRVANLTAPLTHEESPQRGTCQYRNLCIRGCPYGGYFSSVSATLPSAERTGNMTLLANKIVYELIYDNDKGKATGVRVLDAETGAQTDYFAKVIFLCASTLGSAFIMLNSVSSRFPNGFGNDSGELGHNIMDHLKAPGVERHGRRLSRRGLHRPARQWLLHSALSQCRQGQARLPARLRLPGPRLALRLRAVQRQRAHRCGAQEGGARSRVRGRSNASAFGEILPNHVNHAASIAAARTSTGCRCSRSTRCCARTSSPCRRTW